ncbi:hypothetical protein [Cupriavidus sp. UYPR2.512]|uniref:hypothetical protein n=1 Tax=Cupriavidus sp. UYPR2.512 TaxID=1080187 RepID=UPI00037A1516|nr:hypothetical protein [Cupriavidus sp. UYPR2.512]UIF89450.1 hypothetical protein KAF44_29725 [Cupriavidus necator]
MKPKFTFTPTDRMVAAVEAFLAARLCEQEIEPIVTKYQQEILSRHRFKAVRLSERGEEVIILDPNQSYRISDEDSVVYFAECRKARDAAQLTIEGEEQDVCPHLKAKHALVLAENELIKSMSVLPQLESLGGKLYCLKLEDRKKLVELSLGLVVPFVSRGRAAALAQTTLAQYARFAPQPAMPQ